MEITLTLKELIWYLVGIGLAVLVVYAIILLKNLIITVKSMNVILKDTEEVTGIISERTKDIDQVVGDVSESIKTVSKNVDGSKGVIHFIGSIIGIGRSVYDFFKGDKKS